MKVRLEDIPPEGLDVAFSDQGVGAEDLGPQVGGIIEAPRAKLHIQRQNELVLARGSFEAVLALECSRCLAKMEYSAQGELVMLFSPEPSLQEREVELGEQDMEQYFHNGEEIDLGQGLRDEVALSLPMAPLCSENCPGLCPECGKPLAQGLCGCKKDSTDPRWAALAKLKEQ